MHPTQISKGSLHTAYPPWQRMMEMLAILGFCLVCTVLAAAVYRGALAAYADRGTATVAYAVWWTALILTPLTGYVAAEFGAGMVHCLADNSTCRLTMTGGLS